MLKNPKLYLKYCAAKFCTSSSNEDVSFFRFPEDVVRCVQWVNNLRCHHLMVQVADLHKLSYRVCSKHFEKKYLNKTPKRFLLTNDAVPMLLIHPHPTKYKFGNTSVQWDHTYTQCFDVEVASCIPNTGSAPFTALRNEHMYTQYIEMEETSLMPYIGSAASSEDTPHYSNHNTKYTEMKEPQLQMVMPSSPSSSRQQSQDVYQPVLSSVPQAQIPRPVALVALPSTSRSLCYTSTQTSRTLTAYTTRITKLRSKIRTLQRKLKTQTRSDQAYTLQDFKVMCDQFLPVSCANFIKLQAELHNKPPIKRRYSKDFLNTCLRLYFTGPKAYRMLSTLFILPSKRTLSRQTKLIQ